MTDKKTKIEKDNASELDSSEVIYKLSENALRNGYSGKIDGRQFVVDFERSFDGKRISQFASVTSPVSTPAGIVNKPMRPEVYELKGLTELQIHELNVAQIIELDKVQAETYRQWRKERFKKID